MPTIRDIVRNVALEYARKGAGMAQTGPVLAEVARQLGSEAHSVEKQQEALTAFNDLFRDGELSWGYNFDNPKAPFFHASRRS